VQSFVVYLEVLIDCLLMIDVFYLFMVLPNVLDVGYSSSSPFVFLDKVGAKRRSYRNKYQTYIA